MIKKALRKLLRRLVMWAIADPEPTTLINWDINTGLNRFNAKNIFICGASTPEGRKAIVSTIKTAKTHREL